MTKIKYSKVSISLRLLSRPKEDMLPMIYKTLGIDFDERVLPSVGNEVLKSVVARVKRIILNRLFYS